MNFKEAFFYCSPRLLKSIPEIDEIRSIVRVVDWQSEKLYTIGGRSFKHQTGYNKHFETEFSRLKWELQPKLLDHPKLIGDFGKRDTFVEVQFGNSSALFRDYYKFHYGLTHHLLSMAVLVAPTDPIKFFPTRPRSVSNMAEYDLADRYFGLLPIPVPILLIGLLPEN